MRLLSWRSDIRRRSKISGVQIFQAVKAHLNANGMAMKKGKIIDATLITSPTSTKNKQGKRDPEIH